MDGRSGEYARIEQALPAYELLEELGRGGTGTVYLARHRTLGRRVAIKHLAHVGSEESPERRRFRREAATLAGFDHPHLVVVHDYLESPELCLLVMEALEGGSVWDWYKDGGMSVTDACAVGLTTLAALEYTHARGILHRDIKPANLLFSEGGTLKVADFGIAKPMLAATEQLTQLGQIVGSPAFMAPEQVVGHPVTAATDLYALGTVLYLLMSGRLPQDEVDNAPALLAARVAKDPVPLGAVSSVPDRIAAVVMVVLARDPAARLPTAKEMYGRLSEAAERDLGPSWHRGVLMRMHAEATPPPRATGPLDLPSISAAVDAADPLLLSATTRAGLDSEAAPQQPTTARIAIDVTPPQGASWRIALAGPVELGRAGTDVVIDDPEVSRRHVRITPAGDAATVEDLGSTNGTLVNAQLITQATIVGPEDVVEIGATTLRVARD